MASRNATMVYRDQAHDDSRSVTIGELRSEFSTLDRQLTSQFDSQYAFHKDVISDILKRIEEARRSIESIRHELHQGFKKQRGSIDGLKAINRNRFAIRPYMQIWKYPTDEDEVPKCFPTTVAAFWALQTPPNQHKLSSLLESYKYKDYLEWAEFDEFGDPIDVTEPPVYPGDDTPLNHYVEQYPEKAHRVLASILGLEYDLIREQMEKLLLSRVQPHGGSSKRPAAEGDTQTRKNARFAMSDNSSLTEEIHRGEPGDYKQTYLSSSSS